MNPSYLRCGCAAVLLLAGFSWGQAPEALSDSVEVFRALDFAQTPTGSLQLDLYLPRDASEPTPAIVVIPGGGFRAQTREKFAAEARTLAEAGFAAAIIGVRPTTPFWRPSRTPRRRSVSCAPTPRSTVSIQTELAHSGNPRAPILP